MTNTNTKKTRIYLSGDSNTADTDNMNVFQEAQTTLTEMGFSVCNPAIMSANMPEDTTYEEYLVMRFNMMDMCTKVCVLPNAEASEFTEMELRHAKSKGIDVVTYEELIRPEKNEVATDYITREEFYALMHQFQEQEEKRFEAMTKIFDDFTASINHVVKSMSAIPAPQKDTGTASKEMKQDTVESTLSVHKEAVAPQETKTDIVSVKKDCSLEEEKAIVTEGFLYCDDDSAEKYKDDILAICRKIVEFSDFKNTKEVLCDAYKYLTKNYGICWEQEKKEHRRTHYCDGRVSTLTVVAESSKHKHLRSLLRCVLEDTLNQSIQTKYVNKNNGLDTHYLESLTMELCASPSLMPKMVH